MTPAYGGGQIFYNPIVSCPKTNIMSTPELFAQSSLHNWEQPIRQITSFFDKCSDEELLQPIVPGKNRIIYILGHMAAVHDRMLPLLSLGDRLYPHLDETFLTNPDNPQAAIPDAKELREAWNTVNNRITEGLRNWSPEEWLQPHTAVSAEDFAKE